MHIKFDNHILLQDYAKLWMRAYEIIGEPHFDSLKFLFHSEPCKITSYSVSTDSDTDSEDPYNSWDCRDV